MAFYAESSRSASEGTVAIGWKREAVRRPGCAEPRMLSPAASSRARAVPDTSSSASPCSAIFSETSGSQWHVGLISAQLPPLDFRGDDAPREGGERADDDSDRHVVVDEHRVRRRQT